MEMLLNVMPKADQKMWKGVTLGCVQLGKQAHGIRYLCGDVKSPSRTRPLGHPHIQCEIRNEVTFFKHLRGFRKITDLELVLITPCSHFQCSKSCGNGIRTRTVVCNGVKCDAKSKPTSRVVCNLGPCLEWKVGEWQQVRVTFVDATSIIPFFFFALSLIFELWLNFVTRRCAFYFFKQCSVSCGRGWKRRKVECTAKNNRCDYRSKPDVYTMCDMGKCPTWRIGRWSEVSET